MKKMLALLLAGTLVACQSAPKPPAPSGAWTPVNQETKSK